MWPWRSLTAASASSEAIRSSSVSPIPTRMPLVNGIRSSPAASIVRRRSRRVLGRRAGVHRLHQALRDRLEHQPLRGGHLAQPGQVLARSGRRGSCAAGARARARARRPRPRRRRSPSWPQDAKPRGDLRVDLGPLAGEHEQLLGVSPHRLVEPALDLVGRVEVRPMGREGAVLAVAAAGPRQRERVVAREGDAPHDAQATAARASATCGAAGPPSRRRQPRSRPPRRPPSEALDRARTATRRSRSGRGPRRGARRRSGRRCRARRRRTRCRSSAGPNQRAGLTADAGERPEDHHVEAERQPDRQRGPLVATPVG